MSFHPTQPLLANGHPAWHAVIEAGPTPDVLGVRMSVLETMLAESIVREMENMIKYRLKMESLKRTHEAEITALRNTNAELLQARVVCLDHLLRYHLSQPVAVASGATTADQPEAAGSKRRRTSGPERE